MAFQTCTESLVAILLDELHFLAWNALTMLAYICGIIAAVTLVCFVGAQFGSPIGNISEAITYSFFPEYSNTPAPHFRGQLVRGRLMVAQSFITGIASTRARLPNGASRLQWWLAFLRGVAEGALLFAMLNRLVLAAPRILFGRPRAEPVEEAKDLTMDEAKDLPKDEAQFGAEFGSKVH